jgi:hypothetical protein
MGNQIEAEYKEETDDRSRRERKKKHDRLPTKPTGKL